MQTTLTAIIIGIVASSSIITYQNSCKEVAPILGEAIQWQDNTVNLYAELFPESSKEAVAQWAERKPVAERRLESLREFSNSGEVSGLEQTAGEIQLEAP